jgi:hypothetical protein
MQAILVALGTLQLERLAIVCGQPPMCAIIATLFSHVVPRDSRR